MKQTEIKWRDRRVVQVDYTRNNEFENYGFEVKQVFKVLDDFDDNALPISQQVFWSPSDAIMAIYAVDTITPQIVDKKRWPSTAMFEVNQMLAYRTHFHYVYEALKDIKRIIADAKEWDENPGDKIIARLGLLHQVVHERRERVK